MKEIVLKSKRMKNIFEGDKYVEVKREVLPEVPNVYRTVKSQYDLLCRLHYNDKADYDIFKVLKRELQAKLNSYRQQDIKKKLFDKEKIITIEQIRQKLIDETLTCTFCNKQVVLLYDTVRAENQWTLDRVDNDIGHTNENTKIACLKCNLKRRRIDYDKFHWTRNMTISKLDTDENKDKNDDNKDEKDTFELEINDE